MCFNKSFASYDGLTETGIKKVDCWDYDKNDINPEELMKFTVIKCFFICDVCNHNFKSMISNITSKNRPTWCPYCSQYNRILCNDEKCSFCFNNSFASYDSLTIKGNLKLDKDLSKANGKLNPGTTADLIAGILFCALIFGLTL